MQELITSFIIQSGECRLRDVGRFEVVSTSAEIDIANKTISPPATEIIFTAREEKISDGLVKYIAEKKNIPPADALDRLKKWCLESRGKLKNGEEISFAPLGVMKKGTSATVFVPTENKMDFFEPVAAERVIHLNSEHAMLVGDKETTSTKMNQFYRVEEPPKNNTWKIISIILLAIGLCLLFLHFYKNPFSLSTIGNQHKVIPVTPPNTYTNQ